MRVPKLLSKRKELRRCVHKCQSSLQLKFLLSATVASGPISEAPLADILLFDSKTQRCGSWDSELFALRRLLTSEVVRRIHSGVLPWDDCIAILEYSLQLPKFNAAYVEIILMALSAAFPKDPNSFPALVTAYVLIQNLSERFSEKCFSAVISKRLERCVYGFRIANSAENMQVIYKYFLRTELSSDTENVSEYFASIILKNLRFFSLAEVLKFADVLTKYRSCHAEVFKILLFHMNSLSCAHLTRVLGFCARHEIYHRLLLVSVSQRCVQLISSFLQEELLDILCFFLRLKYSNAILLANIADRLDFTQFSPSDCLRFLNSVVKLKFFDFDVNSFTMCVRNCIGAFNSSQLIQLLCQFSTFESNFSRDLVEHIKGKIDQILKVKDVVDIADSLARIRYRDEDLLCHICDFCATRAGELCVEAEYMHRLYRSLEALGWNMRIQDLSLALLRHMRAVSEENALLWALLLKDRSLDLEDARDVQHRLLALCWCDT